MNQAPQRQRPYWTALVLPLALYLLVFLVIPFINIIVLSFYTYSPTRIWTPELTTANYVDLLDASFLTVLLRTLRLGPRLHRDLRPVWLSARLFPRARRATGGAHRPFLPRHAADGERGDPHLRLAGHSRAERPGQRSHGRVRARPAAVALQRDGGGDRPRQRVRAVHGAAADGIDRAHQSGARGGRAQSRGDLVADVPSRHPAAQPPRPHLRLPAGLQRGDQRLCRADADGRRARARHRPPRSTISYSSPISGPTPRRSPPCW